MVMAVDRSRVDRHQLASSPFSSATAFGNRMLFSRCTWRWRSRSNRCELRHADVVGRAAVGRRDVPICQLADQPQLVGGFAMLAFHHANRIFHRAERARHITAAGATAVASSRTYGNSTCSSFSMCCCEVVRELVEARSDTRQFRVAGAVHLRQLGQITLQSSATTTGRTRGASTRCDRSADRAATASHPSSSSAGRRQGVERPHDVGGIDRGSPARLSQIPPAAAAEVDAELFEDRRRAEIGRDNFADRHSRHPVRS